MTLTENKVNDTALRKIFDFIFQQKELDLESYRKNFLLRRLSLRLQAVKCPDYGQYLKLLQEDPQEVNRFLDNLSINVTEFFRDPEVFEAFRKTVLKDLLARNPAASKRLIRIWSAGCASGEEAYSLAVCAAEELEGKAGLMVRILGTDIDEAALEEAKKGEYEAQKLNKIDPRLREKYFVPANRPEGDGAASYTPEGDGAASNSRSHSRSHNNYYRVSGRLRQMVEFKKCNLAEDPPIKMLDVIFCRNVMIYLSRPQKDDLFSRFHCLLNPEGYLVLSKVETLWEKDKFKTILPKEKIYQKIG